MFKKYFSFSINQDVLKIYALIAMTVDHYAMIFSPHYAKICRIYGRFAFPIFSFLIMYHLAEKQIFKKYITRLSIFGVLSALVVFPFQTTFSLNIFFTFLWPIISLYLFKQINNDKMPTFVKIYLYALTIVIMASLSCLSSYFLYGYFYLLGLYFFLRKPNCFLYIAVLALAFFMNYDDIWGIWGMITSCLTTFLLLQIDMGKKYPRLLSIRYFFYFYYPFHLFCLYIIKTFI